MKSELDSLMQQRSLDALLVSGGTHENPCMYYLANGAKVGASTLAIKQRRRAKFKSRKLLAAEAGDALRAHAWLVQALCEDFGLAGSVGVYERVEQGHTLALFADLAQRAPALWHKPASTHRSLMASPQWVAAACPARHCPPNWWLSRIQAPRHKRLICARTE